MLADELVEEKEDVASPSHGIADPLVVPEVLVSLVDHSLLRQEDQEDGEPRFIMLETVRDFTWEQLHDSGEADVMQRRHAAFMLAFARATAPSLKRTAQPAEVDGLVLEINNIRAALAWTLDHGEGAQALRLATVVIQLWFMRGMPAEGRQWLERSLAVTSETLDRARADALLCAASLAFLQEDLDTQTAYAREAANLARALDYRFGIALAHFQLGVAAERQHELERAFQRYEQALALMLTLDAPYWIALLLSNLGEICLLQGRLDDAEKLASEGLARWRACSNEWGLAQGLGTMAAIAAERGDAVGAATLYLEALVRSRSLEDRRGLAGAVAGLAGLAATPAQAARLLGAARAMGDAAGVRLMAHHLQFERVLAATRARLEAPAFDREWTVGHFLPLAQAMTEAEELARTIISSPALPVAAEGRSCRSMP
jgi:tetratricopeptide (TPR) repeat protein